jgi:outer membrane biosynthesis protein TonB
MFLALVACRGPDQPAEEPAAEQPASDPAPAADTAEPAPSVAEPSAAEPGAGEPSGAGVGGGHETRTTDVIAQIIRDNRKPFRDCYEKGKKKIPELEGTLTLFFVLNPRGEVKQAELNRERSDIVEPVVVDCALAALKSIKFPPSSRGMESTVNYPFDFKR